MKKIGALLIFTVMLFNILSISAINVDDKNEGITFTLSDNWTETGKFKYECKQNRNEEILIETSESGWTYKIDILGDGNSEETLRETFDEIYSDSKLARGLSDVNNAFVTVKTVSVQSGFEYYNGNKFYRYDKTYTASALGFRTETFRNTVYFISKNGYAYMFEYQGRGACTYFWDFVNMVSSVSFANGEIKVKIDDEIIKCDTEPLLIEGRTLVPIRAIAERMGYTVSWEPENQIVRLTDKHGGTEIAFAVGLPLAVKNASEDIELDVPPVIYEGRTYLPLRAVAEAMDAKVNWNSGERTAEIVTAE